MEPTDGRLTTTAGELFWGRGGHGVELDWGRDGGPDGGLSFVLFCADLRRPIAGPVPLHGG